MGSPIFFVQTRSGKNKKYFKIFKFRTMIAYTASFKEADRLTRLGIFLRKFSLDELPQLFNVIKGDMSLIGPRPLLIEYDDHYSDTQNLRFKVKPGITGLAQVQGRNNLTWEEKFELDIKYVQQLSFINDVKILIKTIRVVFFSKGFKSVGEDKKFNEK
jgi:lipopolysaccharide/colanic/teichoic acid biosynthesis glycosyltransferase